MSKYGGYGPFGRISSIWAWYSGRSSRRIMIIRLLFSYQLYYHFCVYVSTRNSKPRIMQYETVSTHSVSYGMLPLAVFTAPSDTVQWAFRSLDLLLNRLDTFLHWRNIDCTDCGLHRYEHKLRVYLILNGAFLRYFITHAVILVALFLMELDTNVSATKRWIQISWAV